MSESSKIYKSAPLQQIRWIVIVIIVILVLGYVGGYFILPGMVKSAYQDGNCEAVLSRNDIYSRVYPAMITNGRNTALVRECAIYTLGITNEEAGAWHDSYNAFRVYSETYSQGLFAVKAHEHSAIVLMALAKDDAEKKDYLKANDDLDFIMENYGDTATVADAEKLKSDIRMALGTDLRETGDFAGAEQIFKEINVWGQENNREEDVRSSQLELAQTYLTWGLKLQSQKNYAEAKAKFDNAISTDPDPSSESGPAAQAKTSMSSLYVQWGDHLIGQKDFANAMERYKTAASMPGGNNPSSANEIVANGYIQWASELVREEDFLGALVLLDFAQASSSTNSTQTLVDDARSDLYLAFSKSDGEQAQKAMDDAVQIVCEHHIAPSLPIFGLDEKNIRAKAYGAGDQLSGPIAATTPASLHYVACVEEDNRVVGTLTVPVSSREFGGGPGVTVTTYANFQYFWKVVLRKIESGEEVETTTIDGVKPAKLEVFTINFKQYNYFGPKPSIADLADWIQTVIE